MFREAAKRIGAYFHQSLQRHFHFFSGFVLLHYFVFSFGEGTVELDPVLLLFIPDNGHVSPAEGPGL